LPSLSDSTHALCEEALEVLKAVDLSIDEDKVCMDGAHHLLGKPEFRNTQKSRSLLETLEHSRELLDWMESSMDIEDTMLYIGKENPCSRIKDCTVVMSPYRVNDRLPGVMAVLGPTRMPYSTVVPTMDYMSEFVSNFYREL